MARLATRDTDEALDLVQDAMIRLVERYARKPESEWAPLFYTILHSRIRDWQRRQAVRRRWRVWFGGGDADHDAVMARIPDHSTATPPAHLAAAGALSQLELALAALPARQREAFLLRSWEGLDVAQTARAMGCSPGSVKTHYSRAVHSLRAQLADHVDAAELES
jgi:RNA polymerase sigma-70 factor (ECF subfamily)